VRVVPQTRYAKSDGLNIAYQVFGKGPIDLVLVPGFVSHVEVVWEEPRWARFLERLGGFCRVLMFDKRGTGMSDRVSLDRLPTLEERMDDVRAVMDAVGSNRAALFGVSEGGPMCTLFAATYPERTVALVVFGGYARWIQDDDFPSAPTREQHEVMFGFLEAMWGEVVPIAAPFAPSMDGDMDFAERAARSDRMSSSPGAAVALYRMNIEVDVRSILSSVAVPTLVMHRSGDELFGIEQGRYLADHIPGARFVEFPGDDHLPMFGDSDAVVDEIEEFLTGARGGAAADRVLATVLFTDIVQSTEQLVATGDREWRMRLDRHDALVRAQLTRFRGREVSTAGDSFFAVFDGPARAIRCAHAIMEDAESLNIKLRAGLHTGECEVRGNDYSGIAVHVGARIAALAGPGEILTSGTVKDLVAGSGLTFSDRGTRELKGIPDTWHVYQVT
jgi:pimeloyl-ACP methyl ester carboxylesterase/class 3 adenylate cyclase